MPSITHQKADIKALLHEHVMREYDERPDEDRREIAQQLLSHLMAKMTLRELRQWHQGLTINAGMQERHATPPQEQ